MKFDFMEMNILSCNEKNGIALRKRRMKIFKLLQLLVAHAQLNRFASISDKKTVEQV